MKKGVSCAKNKSLAKSVSSFSTKREERLLALLVGLSGASYAKKYMTVGGGHE